MARVRPFSAYRYQLGRVKAQDVVTQPYDKITPDMRQRYMAQSPYNLVRIILGEKQPGDDERNSVYTRAAGYLSTWIRDGILRADPEPAIYPYTQTFNSPETGERHTRKGFIALGAIEDYDKHVVFRHEQTLSGPKLDRQALLRATHAHFGQLFMLYSDPAQSVESELLSRAKNPILDVTDEYGTVHRVFRETDGAVIDRLRQRMAPLPLVIADGHHRYETALSWRNEQNALTPHRSAAPGEAPWDWVMMTLVNLDAPGLVVLPTHRLVHSLPDFDSATALRKLGEYFDVESLTAPLDGGRAAWDEARPRLAAAGSNTLGLALQGHDSLMLLRLKPSVDMARELPEYSAEQRRLNVLVLHEIALHRALGITPEAVREERNLRYLRDAAEAMQSVQAGAAQAVFFLNPIPPAQVRDVALAGGVMPQKSTDFYPKMLTGLTIYKVD